MKDTHEQEEQELAELAKTKTADDLTDAADDTVPLDCGYDEYHTTIDSIELGFGSKSKKDIWTVAVPDEDGEESLAFIFIDTSFENVKKRIQKLPGLLSDSDRKNIVKKLKTTIPKVRDVAFQDPSSNDVSFLVDTDKDGWHGKIVDGARLCACIDPNHHMKKFR